MSHLWRDFWIRETGTGQQVAQLHDRYMMMMINVLLATLSLWIDGFCSEWATAQPFSRRVFKKALSLQMSTSGLPMLLTFPAHPGPDHPMATFTETPGAGSGPTSGCEEPSVANFQLFHFPQFPFVLAPISVEPCYVLSVSHGTDHNSRLVWSLSWNY